jgi:uncharacterized protein
MKFVVLVLVVGGMLLWLFGRGRRSLGPRKPEAGAPPQAPQAMITCAHCGVHLPREDAVEHDGRSYCSQAHQIAGPAGRE